MIKIKPVEEKKPTPFILGAHITGLNLIRNFGRKGFDVYGLDHNPKAPGLVSKYCTSLLNPNPRNFEKEYIDFLVKIGQKKKHKGVLFPTSDIDALAILKNKKLLENYYHFTLSNYRTSNLLINKELFFQTLEENNILYPKTYYPKKISDLYEINKKAKYPCLVKPKYSAFFRMDFKRKCFIANNLNQLIYFYKLSLSKKNDVIVQEMIQGEACDMYGYNAYYNKKNRPNGIFSYRRIRQWPPIIGNGCLLEENHPSEFEKIITPLLKKINYFGLVDAEFKRDTEEDKYYLIEINPRAWMQIGFPTRCGYDHAYMAYLDAIDEEIQLDKKDNVDKWLLFQDDICSAILDISKKKISIQDYILSLKGKRENAFFCWDDPLPFIKSLSYGRVLKV